MEGAVDLIWKVHAVEGAVDLIWKEAGGAALRGCMPADADLILAVEPHLRDLAQSCGHRITLVLGDEILLARWTLREGVEVTNRLGEGAG